MQIDNSGRIPNGIVFIGFILSNFFYKINVAYFIFKVYLKIRKIVTGSVSVVKGQGYIINVECVGFTCISAKVVFNVILVFKLHTVL